MSSWAPGIYMAVAICPPGKRVTGGGFYGQLAPSINVLGSYPENERYWRLLFNYTPGESILVFAICANVA